MEQPASHPIPPPNHSVLDLLAAELPLSAEFRQMMAANHFTNLRDLLRYPAHQLLRMEGFGYRMLKELITLLEQHSLTDQLQE